MANESAWADAYHEQSKEDLEAAKYIGKEGIAPSVFCMLMQMFYEKMAKAALLKSGYMLVDNAIGSHKGALTLIAILERMRKKRPELNNISEREWNIVCKNIEELESLQPSFAKEKGKQKLEYPWEDFGGNIKWPSAHLDIVERMQNPRYKIKDHLLAFAGLLSENFDSLFT